MGVRIFIRGVPTYLAQKRIRYGHRTCILAMMKDRDHCAVKHTMEKNTYTTLNFVHAFWCLFIKKKEVLSNYLIVGRINLTRNIRFGRRQKECAHSLLTRDD